MPSGLGELGMCLDGCKTQLAREQARLGALCRYDLLDTPPEKDFDDLTRLAAQLCEAPIALITLIDSRRQWFKSAVGLDVPETPRDVAFCRYALQSPDLLLVPDATLDTRFAQNPLVTGPPFVRAYAGAPLVTPDGHILGTLCVLDTRPRTFSEDQQKAIESLSRQTVAQIELRRRVGESEAREEESVRSAERLRQSEEQYRLLFNAHPSPMWVYDPTTLHIKAVNDAALGNYGYSREEFLGLSIADLRPEQEVPHLQMHLQNRPDGASHSGVFQHRRKDGRVIWADITAYPLTFEGHPCRMVTAQDVTERRDAEENLRQHHSLLQTVMEGIGEALYVKDLAGRYLLINSAGARAIGRPAGEIIGRDDAALFPPETARRTRDHDRRILSTGRTETYEDTETGRGTGGRTFLSRKGVYRDVCGEIAGIFGISHDITTRKQAEDTLRARERQMQTVTNNVPAMIARIDAQERYLFCNAMYQEVTGLPPGAIVGQSLADVLGSDTYRVISPYVRRVLAGEAVTFEAHIPFPHGGLRFMHISYTPENDPEGGAHGFVLSAVDITERQRAEEGLRRAEEKYRSIFENAVEGIFQSAPGGGFLSANPALVRILGYDSPADLLASVSDIGTQVYASPSGRAEMLRQLETRGMVYDCETEMRRKDGTRVWVGLTARAVCDPTTGRRLYVEGSAVDITARQEAERALRESETRFQSAFRNAPTGMCLTDAAGNYLQINRALCDLVGYTEAEMVARGFAGITHPDDIGADLHQYRQMLEGHIDAYAMEKRYLHRNGSIVWVALSVSAVRDAAGQTLYSIAQIQDITRRRALEEEQGQAQERLRLRDRAIAAASNGIVISDPHQPDCPIVYCNPAFLALTGYAEHEVIGHNCRFLQGPETDGQGVQQIRNALRAGTESQKVLKNYKKDGTPFWNDLAISPVRSADGEITHFIGIQTDVTARKELEDEREQAMHEALERADRDPLTGLLNHRAFHKKLDEECGRAEKADSPVAVVMLDLDNFKFFNDAYGHPAGDGVLRRVGEMLSACARPGDTVARFGGDEFALILPGLDAEGAAALVRRMCDRTDGAGYRPEGSDVAIPLALSAGTAVWPHDHSARLEVVERADERLRRSKTGADDLCADDLRTRMGRSLDGFSMLDALVTAVDNKDRYTRRHSEDVLAYSLQIADEMGLDERTRRTVSVAALLHDVGKIGVPDSILRKPGRLTEEEFKAVQNHPMMGAVIVGAVPGLEETLDAVRHHHERWDGGGYPFGLSGEEAPLLARLMAVADAFSAMTTDRPYRKGMTHGRALAILAEGAGTQWDPRCVQAFLRAQSPAPALAA